MISSIFNAIINFLKNTVVAWIVEIITFIIGIFLIPVKLAMQAVMVFILTMVDFLEMAFNVLAGVTPVSYQTDPGLMNYISAAFNDMTGTGTENKDYLLNIILGSPAISRAFNAITILGLILCIVFTIVAITQSIGSLDGKRPLGQVLGVATKSFLTFFLVPIVVLVGINLSTMFLVKTREVIAGGGTTYPISAYILSGVSMMCDKGTIIAIYESFGADVTYSMTDPIRAKYFMAIPASYMLPTMIVEFKFFPLFFGVLVCCLFIGFVMMSTLFIFIRNIFEIVILYLISPFFVASMPLDDGARFKAWREAFLSRVFTGYGSIIAMQVYLVTMPVLTSHIKYHNNFLVNSFIKLIVLVASPWAILKAKNIFPELIGGQAAAMREHAGIAGAKKLGKTAATGVLAAVTGGGSLAAAGTRAVLTGSPVGMGGVGLGRFAGGGGAGAGGGGFSGGSFEVNMGKYTGPPGGGSGGGMSVASRSASGRGSAAPAAAPAASQEGFRPSVSAKPAPASRPAPAARPGIQHVDGKPGVIKAPTWTPPSSASSARSAPSEQPADPAPSGYSATTEAGYTPSVASSSPAGTSSAAKPGIQHMDGKPGVIKAPAWTRPGSAPPATSKRASAHRTTFGEAIRTTDSSHTGGSEPDKPGKPGI